MEILAISGSLRAQSINLTLLEAAKRLAPPEFEVTIFANLGAIPLFSPDLDTATPPLVVDLFREAIASADGILISSPEYARGVPGALKNALDWLVSDHRVAGKAVALVNAASGGGQDATTQLSLILTTMATKVVFAESLVGADVRQHAPHVEATVRRALEALAATKGP